jgi:hypothetical protein
VLQLKASLPWFCHLLSFQMLLWTGPQKRWPSLALRSWPHYCVFFFGICKLLYDLNLVLFQQLVLIVPPITTQIWWLAITMNGWSFPRNHDSLLWCNKLIFF